MKKIYNRKTKQFEPDQQYGGKALHFLYHTAFGRILLKLAISPLFSRLNGAYNKSALSKKKINTFIKQYSISMDDYETKTYTCFRDFFIRKKKEIRIEKDSYKLISPADAKLLVYRIDNKLRLPIKNSIYTLAELIGKEKNLSDFSNGYCMVFRLSMDDYHRYCFVDDGTVKEQYHLKGKLHTVSSISEHEKVFSRNSRIVNVLDTKNFGKMLVVEVGALLVGKICNHPIRKFQKGEEKGFFDLGGSTIILFVSDRIIIDQDILQNSHMGIETKVQYGEAIGVKLC